MKFLALDGAVIPSDPGEAPTTHLVLIKDGVSRPIALQRLLQAIAVKDEIGTSRKESRVNGLSIHGSCGFTRHDGAWFPRTPRWVISPWMSLDAACYASEEQHLYAEFDVKIVIPELADFDPFEGEFVDMWAAAVIGAARLGGSIDVRA